MNRLDMLEAGRAALPFQLTTAQERVLGQVGDLLSVKSLRIGIGHTHVLLCRPNSKGASSDPC